LTAIINHRIVKSLVIGLVQEVSQVLLVEKGSLAVASFDATGACVHAVSSSFLQTHDGNLIDTDQVSLLVLALPRFNLLSFGGGDGDADVLFSQKFSNELVEGISVHELVGYSTHDGGDGVKEVVKLLSLGKKCVSVGSFAHF